MEEESLADKAKAIDKAMTEVEEALYQTKNRSGQDPLNFPICLTNKLAGVASLTSRGDYPPTAQSIAVKNELTSLIHTELAKFRQIKATELPAFNQMVKEKGVDAVIVK